MEANQKYYRITPEMTPYLELGDLVVFTGHKDPAFVFYGIKRFVGDSVCYQMITGGEEFFMDRSMFGDGNWMVTIEVHTRISRNRIIARINKLKDGDYVQNIHLPSQLKKEEERLKELYQYPLTTDQAYTADPNKLCAREKFRKDGILLLFGENLEVGDYVTLTNGETLQIHDIVFDQHHGDYLLLRSRLGTFKELPFSKAAGIRKTWPPVYPFPVTGTHSEPKQKIDLRPWMPYRTYMGEHDKADIRFTDIPTLDRHSNQQEIRPADTITDLGPLFSTREGTKLILRGLTMIAKDKPGLIKTLIHELQKEVPNADH